MQAFLCLVLGGTLALAAFVRHRMNEREVRFEKAAEFGPFLVQRPSRWAERFTQDGVVFEELSTRGRPRRRLEIWTAFAPVFMSPLEYVARSDDARLGDVAALLARAPAQALRRASSPLLLAGWNGVTLSQSRLIGATDAPPKPAAAGTVTHTSLACALLPSGQVVLLRLDGEGLDDADADRIVRKVGRTLRLTKQAFPVTEKELPLDEGVAMRVPPAFATFAAKDELRVSRLLVGQAPEEWMAVDVVPCVTRPGDAPDTLRSIMTMRDPLFRAGPVETIDDDDGDGDGGRTWACRREDESHPALVFLRDVGDGRAVLAEFRWVPTGDGDGTESRVREAWGLIVKGLEAVNLVPVEPMVERGRLVAMHLPRDTVGLLERAQPEERWQWYHEAVSRQSETRLRYGQDGQRIMGSWEMDQSPPLAARGGREQGWFWLSRDWNGYRCVVTRDDAGVLSQITRLTRGVVRSAVLAGRQAVAEGTWQIDSGFVPGAVFMLVLGRLPAEPVVLTTDWVVNPTGAASAGPVTLVLSPVFAKAQTRPAAATQPSGQPEVGWRSWEVRVNGRSFASRWELDAQGRVESVTFGGNVRMRRVKQEEGEGREDETR